MHNIDFVAFNKGLYIRMSHTEMWERGKIEAIRTYLSEYSPVPPERKNELPQFIFNVEEGSRSTTLRYPQEILITEIDLPTEIKQRVKNEPELIKHWKSKFISWYNDLKDSGIPYWLMYITPSRMGLRFVIRSEVIVQNETEYREACLQFLKLLEPYGINRDYHDLISVNRGWYFPPDKKFCHLKAESFKPQLLDLPSPKNNTDKTASKPISENKEEVEMLIQQIELKEIDITNEYQDWINIGFALSSELGEDGLFYFHRISQFYPDYNTKECDRQFKFCLKSGRGEITIRTLFFIAKKYGIQYKNSTNDKVDKFWFHVDFVTRINHNAYFNMLHTNGIGRLETKHGDDIIFIKVDHIKKAVKQISKFEISVFTTQHIENLNIDIKERDQVANAFLSDSKILMAKNYAAIRPIKVDFVKEDANTMYFYYTNCFVKVTKTKITTHTYDELGGYIWESQIIPREYRILSAKEVKEKSEFYTFIQDVSSDMQHNRHHKRFLSLKTAIGYLLHTYKDPAVPKSIVFMDASLKKDTNGRTGKGIVKTALGKMRKLATEDGKHFNFRSQFCFSQVTLDTDILFIDDVTNRFDFEKLFSVLAEGVVVERKFKDKFHLAFEDSPKILLTTNYAIQGSGDSFEGRIHEYEFSDYYRLGNTPKDKFKHLLFDHWDQDQWFLFDNFMVGCAKSYLRLGLKESEFINLHLKKVISKTGYAFVEYLRDNIEINTKYEKQKVFDDFIAENPSYRDWGRNSFTIYMKEYYKYKRKEVKETHSGTTHFFMVITSNSDLS